MHDIYHAVDLLHGQSGTFMYLPLTQGARSSLRFELRENARRMDIGLPLFGDMASVMCMHRDDTDAWLERLNALLDDPSTTGAAWASVICELYAAVRETQARMGHGA